MNNAFWQGFRIGYIKACLVAYTVIAIICISASPAISAEYSRDEFKHWSDLDHNGKDSRQETILTSMTGGVICPYTGELIKDVSKLDIDHIVPLAFAWEHGASAWTDEQREFFANDPENLIAVSFDVNRAKGASGPDEWLPPNIRFIPEYVAKFEAVCRKYQLACDYERMTRIVWQFKPQRNGIKP